MMAGEWIKMRVDLLTSPKVVRMSSALKADRFKIAGGLLSVWCLFDAHSEDGELSGYDKLTLDDLAAWPGFSEAMEAVGWLVDDGKGLSLPDFEAHNGASAKRRAQDANRKRQSRKESALEADKKETREEKRREDINTTDVVVSTPKKTRAKKDELDYSCWPSLPSEQVFNDWMAMRKAKKSPISQTVINSHAKELQKACDAGYSVDHCLTVAVTSAWAAFRFDWMINQESRGKNYGNKQKKGPSAGLAPDDTSWADALYGPESGAGNSNDQQDLLIIEGDFSSLDGSYQG